jgi:hypothetical protein
MSRKELYKLDKKLNDQLDIDRIVLQKRGFYVYYNKPNRERKPLKIHHHTCGECCFGIGKINKAKPGKNGVWIGPAYSIKALQIIIQDILGADSSLCSCCQIKST